MFTIKLIDSARRQDVRLKNEPFFLWGRMIPSYSNEKWSYTVSKLPADGVTEMCFPDEDYDYGAMCENSIFVGAYDGESCIGLAVLQEDLFKYMYLYDLKVSKTYRRKGVGKLLMEAAGKIAGERGYRGIYCRGQDNNLSACLFYVNTGFQIGGLDTHVYKGTSQEGKADILFYLDA